MRKINLFLVFLVLFTSILKAQNINGILVDALDMKPLAGATLKLVSLKNTNSNFGSISDSKGAFQFKNIPADSFTLNISYVGYEDFKLIVATTLADLDLGTLSVPKTSKQMSEVIIVSKTAPVQQKGDTLQFNASQYKVNPDATVEELLKKMPGLVVNRDGTVTAQGEQVRKVTIDGRDFFGDDATAALRNLPSSIVDKIQVFDRLSDQAQFTGVDDGNTQRAVNVVTKAGMRNGQFGRIYAGVGSNERYQGGGNVSFFKENRRISLVGLTNNINQQNFGSQDILGLTSGGGGRGGFGGGGGRGGGNWGGGGGNFMVGQQSGISKTNALGINFSDKWGEKVNVSGSYFFNNSDINNSSNSGTQSFIKKDTTLFIDDFSKSNSDNYNHRVNERIEYKIDSSNSFIISPNLSFQKNKLLSTLNSTTYYDLMSGLQSESRSSNNSINSGFNFSNNLLYRRSFTKRGRSFSVNLNTSFNDRSGETYLESINKYYNSGNISDSVQQFSDNKTSGRTISTNFNYTEPIGKKGANLQFNINPSFTKNKADKITYQYDELGGKYSVFDTTLSNKFDNTYNTLSSGITYRKGDRDNQFAIGVNYQYSSLKSEQVFPDMVGVDRSFSNILPNFQFRKKLSSKSNIRIFYRARVNEPSVNQLQNVIDNTDQLRLSTGNPELDQQFTHFISTRYTFTNTQKGQSFFANIFIQESNDYVANATYTASRDSVLAPGIILYKGSQLTKPVNLNGYWSLRSFLTFGQPVKFIKSNVNVTGGFTYSRIPGMVNNVNSFSNNYNYSTGAVVASNINEHIDFNISYNMNYNVVKNSIQPQLDQNYINQSAGFQLNLLTKSGWFLQNDVSSNTYSGLSEGFNQNYWLWNAGLGKKFLKDRNGELKLSVFDLLKQNQSISRTVSDSYIQDVQNLVLKQYFMLTFTYNLKNFGKANPNNNRPEENFRRNF